MEYRRSIGRLQQPTVINAPGARLDGISSEVDARFAVIPLEDEWNIGSLVVRD
jgi:hypothetical protein